ncbi:MAG: squalene synthase HpnC [Acidobacteria bacterium]|nr:squalene synthase HpnC [Acidobacteriota bacterium]
MSAARAPAAVREPRLREAYSTCLRLARSHYENFPVASRLLPSSLRPHVAAVYAFARIADDFADEGDCPAATRLHRLARWGERLRRAAGGAPSAGADRTPDERGTEHPDADDIFLAVGHTLAAFDLPVAWFDDLLSAFRQDVTVRRYATWADLLDYCRRSANPVGRIVLRLSGYRDPALDRRSDAVCSALQVTNFLQDLGRDWRAGRLYVPADVQAACGTDLDDLRRERLTPAWRRAVACCAERTRELFREGRPVCDGVRGRLRLELRLTWLGGMRILERVAGAGYDPFASRPVLGPRDVLPLVWRALVWT